jgi:hypothetical protein
MHEMGQRRLNLRERVALAESTPQTWKATAHEALQLQESLTLNGAFTGFMPL